MERNKNKNLPETPIFVKCGGIKNSPYYINPCVLQFDIFIQNPINSDKNLPYYSQPYFYKEIYNNFLEKLMKISKKCQIINFYLKIPISY